MRIQWPPGHFRHSGRHFRRHRCRFFRGVLCPKSARPLDPQYPPPERYPNLHGNSGCFLLDRYSSQSSSVMAILRTVGSIQKIAIRHSSGHCFFRCRHRCHADGSFHRDRNLISLDDRHLSPPGDPREGPGLSRYQRFHKARGGAWSSPHKISGRQVPFRYLEADHRSWR